MPTDRRFCAQNLRRLCGALALGLSCAWAAGPGAQQNEPIALNFSDASVYAVASTMGAIYGMNVLVDPRVQGKITLISKKRVTRDVALAQFLAALRPLGYTMVESGGLFKVVPEADAKLHSAAVESSDTAPQGASGAQVTTQIFKLNYEAANNLVPLLRPLISPNNTINPNPSSNTLVITDYADNLRRIAHIIALLDVSKGTEVEVIALKNAIAIDLAPLVLKLLDAQSAAGAAGSADSSAGTKTSVVAEPRSNSLVVRAATAARVAQVKAIVDKLDQAPSGSNGELGDIHVVYLKNADATKLAATLRAALSGNPPSAAVAAANPGTAGSTPQSGAPASTTGGQVQADTATNSLIITAPEPQYRQLRAVIERLDTRRAQVFVESLIAEISSDRAAEFGVQWQQAIGRSGDAIVGAGGTNFGSGGNNIISLATAIAGANTAVVPGRGFNIGVASPVGGNYVLGFMARFLEDSGAGNVLSTPNLLTLDNEEAKIVIGQNVPFVTGQFTNTGAASGSVNPFQTIERKDVGLTLKVKPQISENGSIKLAIFQEVSNVQPSTVNSANGPTTNKRTIESNVLVDDGSIVVLGGLLQDEYRDSQEKVPGLADLPLIGSLFKSETRGRKKTNLMVFLRPVVVRDAADTERLSVSRYEQMRAGMADGPQAGAARLPNRDGLLLPELGRSNPAPAPAPPASIPPAKPAATN